MTTDHLLVPGDGVAPELLRSTFVAAFADYLIGPFEIGPDAWPGFLARQGVDLRLSRIALGPAGPLAFALVAPRPRRARWRLATMGAVPAARGTGAAARLLDDWITRAAAAGVPDLELEDFAANERACRLYRGRGFVAVHALHGYACQAPPGPPLPPPASVEARGREAALAWLDAAEDRLPDLPLQVTRTALAAQPDPFHAWARGSAQLVFGDHADGSIAVRSLVDTAPSQHDARALVDALLRQHPGRMVQVPQLQRSDIGGEALHDAGFVRLPQHQWLMHRRT